MFIDCDNIRLIEKAYGGNSCEKLAVSYNNENYLLKFPNSLKNKDIRNSSLSYSHSPLSEYVGSHVYSLLGFPTHQTFLGTKKHRIVVLCKDFLDETSMLMELKKWFTTDDSSRSYGSSFNDIGKQIDIDSLLNHIKDHIGYDYIKDEMITRFWDMFVVDCLIENGDRHNGNWGLLKKGNNPCELAPIYDNGSAFRITWDDNKIKKYISDPNMLHELILVKKTTVFKHNGHSVVPGKLINEMHYEDCNKAVVKIVERFSDNRDRIYAFIDDLPKEINGIPCCSDLRKEWMKTSMQFIYDNILLPTYEKTIEGGMKQKETDKNCKDIVRRMNSVKFEGLFNVMEILNSEQIEKKKCKRRQHRSGVCRKK